MTPSRVLAWGVWAIASLFYAYQYILRVMPNILLDDIMHRFDIGTVAFGQFSGVYYVGYALMQLPLGMMLDRFGPRKVMTGSILVSVLGLLPLIFADFWIYPIVGRLLIGMGSSGAILGVFKIIRMTFSETRFPRMLSFSVMIGLLGAIYGGAPVSAMRDAMGYEAVIEVLAAAGLLLALITYIVVPQMQGERQRSLASDLKEVLGNRYVLMTCFFAGLMVGPLEGFADVWGTAFLKQIYGLDKMVSASLPSLIFIGMCFGAPLLNLIAERVGNYLLTIAGAGFAMALSFTLFLSWELSPSAIGANFILIGIGSAYQILAIYKASTYVPASVAGLTTAAANMIIMVFGYAFHSIIGGVINLTGNLVYGIAVVPLALFIGTAGFFFLWAQERRVRVEGS